jgi:hypothetical protein
VRRSMSDSAKRMSPSNAQLYSGPTLIVAPIFTPTLNPASRVIADEGQSMSLDNLAISQRIAGNGPVRGLALDQESPGSIPRGAT